MRGLCALALVGVVTTTLPVRAQDTKALVTVRTPEQEQFELALDEVEIEVQRGSNAPASGSRRSILRVAGASGPADLVRTGTDLEAKNPGGRVNWVLYRPGVAKSPATRVLLTAEVGLILDGSVQPDQLLASIVGRARAVPGVPNAYVVDAGDPLSALNLVERLSQRPGVRTVYSLVKRQLAAR